MEKLSGLPESSVSYWIDSTPKTHYPVLQSGLQVDVAVIGGGIAGITVAYLLKREGKKVALIDRRRIVEGVTGFTTAKVTSQHHLIYQRLQSNFGEEGARAYGEANQAGLELIAALVAERKIDCDFRRKTAYVYALSEAERSTVKKEAEIAAKLGLPASFVDKVELPFKTLGAIAFLDQAEFHPRKYLLALASQIEGNGSYLFENTVVLDVKKGKPCVVKSDRGEMSARSVILATHFPHPDLAFYLTRMAPKRSYAIAFKKRTPVPGMFISAGQPTRSIRSHPIPEGELVIIVGENHKTGQGVSELEHYSRLEEFAKRHYQASSIEYRWSTQDNIPHDGVPYIGKASGAFENIFVATGFQSWGMTNGTAAAMILTDCILKRKNPWVSLFNPQRCNPMVSVGKFVKENVNAVSHMVGDKLKHRSHEDPKKLSAGEGKILKIDGKKVACYRDAEGKVHSVSPVCTHIGCTVRFNDAEKSWDCPCHGSRFDCDGKVLQGPAVADLKPIPI